MFNKPISYKAAQFTESVIREMTRLAMEHKAINLSQGYPDFPAPEVLKQAASDAIFADVNQYAITWGSKSFRDALVYKTKKFMDLDIDPEREITVSCGSTEAMIDVLLAVINPGDEVIVFEPFYENYGPDAFNSGGPTGLSTKKNWRRHSTTTPKPSLLIRRTTQQERSSAGLSCR